MKIIETYSDNRYFSVILEFNKNIYSFLPKKFNICIRYLGNT